MPIDLTIFFFNLYLIIKQICHVNLRLQVVAVLLENGDIVQKSDKIHKNIVIFK